MDVKPANILHKNGANERPIYGTFGLEMEMEMEMGMGMEMVMVMVMVMATVCIGSVEVREFVRAARFLDLKISRDHFMAMISVVDENCDGDVDFNEFQNLSVN